MEPTSPGRNDGAAETIRLVHSPDPDDAFMFWALGEGRVDTGGLRFEIDVDDVESANRKAAGGELDVTAISFAAAPGVSDRYVVLDSGASLGIGYGPVLVSKEECTLADLRGGKVAIPGRRTSAWLALRLALGYEPEAIEMEFTEILDAVEQGRVTAGLVIHEGQLTYLDHQLHRVVDLGAWWLAETGLPLPLGANAVRRDLSLEVRSQVAKVVRASIECALSNREDAIRYAQSFGRGLDEARADRFVSMYVNELTVSMGARGRSAIQEFLGRGHRAGWVPDPSGVEVVG